jgi:hypothetical protein
MNNSRSHSARSAADIDALRARFGLALAARLSEAAERPAGDIAERLRVAREQALDRARSARRVEPAVELVPAGAAAQIAPSWRTPWWLRLASVLPLLALLVGLLLIQESNTRAQIRAAAEIDAALLADDLPPSAYSDPGFGEFLKGAGH